MQNQPAPCVLRVECLAHACRKYHRKLQTFALMDTHDPHRILIFIDDIRLTVIHIIFAQFFDIANKMEQTFIARILIMDRLLDQHLHIRALLALPPAVR